MRGSLAGAVLGAACAAAPTGAAVPPGVALDGVEFSGPGLRGRAAEVVMGPEGGVEARVVEAVVEAAGSGAWALRSGRVTLGATGWEARGGVVAEQERVRVEAGALEARVGPGGVLGTLRAEGGVRVSGPGRDGGAQRAAWERGAEAVTLRGGAWWRVGEVEQRGEVLVVRLPEGAVCGDCPAVGEGP